MAAARLECGEMHLVSRGAGDPVLFLHGIPTSCRLWDGLIERMNGRHTCLAVDLPGLGRTASTPHGFQELDAMVERIEALRIRSGIDRWRLVGHDAGCAIAVHYAHRYQQRVDGLALLTPSIFPDLEPFYLFKLLRTPVLGELAAPAVNLLFWKLVMRRALGCCDCSEEALKDFHAPFTGLRGSWKLMSLLRWGDPADVLASVPAFLPELHIPTMIFHGRKDPAVPQKFATRASGLIPGSEVILLDSGHFLPMSDPAAIAEKLLPFFSNSHRKPQWAAAGD